MLSNARNIRIEWGDCDPAGIVFFPRYLEIFDASTAHLIERAVGMTKINQLPHFDIIGYPLVETRAQFMRPLRFGDDIVAESTITEVRRSSFSIRHRLLKDGTTAVEGNDVRVWAGRDPDIPGKMRSKALPPEVVARLTQS